MRQIHTLLHIFQPTPTFLQQITPPTLLPTVGIISNPYATTTVELAHTTSANTAAQQATLRISSISALNCSQLLRIAPIIFTLS